MGVFVSQTRNGVKVRKLLHAVEQPCGCTEWRDEEEVLRGAGPRCEEHKEYPVWMDLGRVSRDR